MVAVLRKIYHILSTSFSHTHTIDVLVSISVSLFETYDDRAYHAKDLDAPAKFAPTLEM